MRINAQDLEERKDRLLHISYELFCEQGIDAVTLCQISKKSKVALSSIYRYYDSKATLVRHTQKILWGEIVNHILTYSREELLLAQSGWEEINIMFSNFKGLYEQNSRYLLFACDYKLYLMRNGIRMRLLRKKNLFPIRATFIPALERGQADGSVSDQEIPKEQFFVVWGVVRGFVEQIVVYDAMYEVKNPWKERFDVMLNIIQINRGRCVHGY